MKLGRFVSVLVICAVLSVSVQYIYCTETSDSLPFLRMGIGARALSLGGAFTAVSNDASTIFWNPAGLALITGLEIGTMFSLLSLDRTLNMVSVVSPTKFGSIGAGIVNSGVSGIKGYDNNGQPTENLSYQANSINLSYGKMVQENVNVGGNLKLITDSPSKTNSRTGFGLDIGFLSNVKENLTVGVKLQDIINQIGNDIGKDSAPLIATVGGLYKTKIGINLSGDISYNFEMKSAVLKLGGEYQINDSLSVGAGINDTEVSIGFGAKYNKLGFFYTFMTDKFNMQYIHFISLGYKL